MYKQLCKTAFQVLCSLPGIKSFSYNGALTMDDPSDSCGAKIGKTLTTQGKSEMSHKPHGCCFFLLIQCVLCSIGPMSREIFKTAKEVKEQASLQFQPIDSISAAGSISTMNKDSPILKGQATVASTPQKTSTSQQSSCATTSTATLTAVNKRPTKKPLSYPSAASSSASSVIHSISLDDDDQHAELEEERQATTTKR